MSDFKHQADALVMDLVHEIYAAGAGLLPSAIAQIIFTTCHLPELLALEAEVRKELYTMSDEVNKALTNLDAARRKDGV